MHHITPEYNVAGCIFSGYLALPVKITQSSVLVFHAWWGLYDFIINICDKLAKSGFVTLAPDYYDGKIANTIDEAKALRKNLDRKITIRLAALAPDFLIAQSKFEIVKSVQ